MAQPYTDRDLSEGQIIVQQLHGLKGYDAWAEHIAKALAHEREVCAEIVEETTRSDVEDTALRAIAEAIRKPR